MFPRSSICGVTSSDMPEKILLICGATDVGITTPAEVTPGTTVMLVT